MVRNCEACGKPNKWHIAGDIAICHSCYTEEDLARSLLGEAEGKGEGENDIDEMSEQLLNDETEDAFYAHFDF